MTDGMYDTRYENTVFVATVLPPPDKPFNGSNRCSERKLASGRTVVEHVWGYPAAGLPVRSDMPCCCGRITYGEVSN